ncbi:MAG TPA: alkaline phosphatase family protein [Actinomycetota bacterium]|nr:alkaline phosphatase family protein [Actinomycetota bacterium]
MRRSAILLALAVACSGPPSPPPPAPGSSGPSPGAGRGLAAVVCRVDHELLRRTALGTRPDRSGDLQILPREPSFVSAGLSHSGPWDYVPRIPMLWYGPGFIRPGVSHRPATLADVAPTLGALLRFPFPAPDGRVLREVLLPDRPAPRLLLTLVWDAAGREVLDTWPRAWPYLRSLAARGAWFEEATAGASPANTPPSHATIGTGAFPAANGVVDEYERIGNAMLKPYDMGPGVLVLPTLADLYDRAMGNRPVVGTVATLDGHLGMMSHGALWGGGDRDIGVTRQLEGSEKGGTEGFTWNLTRAMAPFYRLPGYVNDVPGFEAAVRALDQADGSLDGRWRDNDIARLKGGFDTPARTTYQSRLVRAVVRREGFGADRIPDLLFVNYKAIDTVGHLFSVNSPEMADTIRVQDEELRWLVSFLDRQVGRGAWAMVLVADHGHQFDPRVTGAFPIDIDRLERAIVERFDDQDGAPVVQRIRPTQIWFDVQELRANGATLGDVARFVMGLTKADTPKPGSVVRPEEGDEPVFEAAFPSAMLRRLPCIRGGG